MATTDIYTVMGGVVDYKPCLRFLGGDVNDQVQINASGAAMANSFTVGTLTAWIMVPDRSGTYTVLSYGDDNVVEYITLDVAAGKLRAICCDNTTVQWSYITTNVVLTPHRWHHVAVVQDGVYPRLYVDGAEVTAVTRTTDTAPTAWFLACAGIDAGSIGAFEGTGDAALTQEFKGFIGPVHVYGHATVSAGAALTADEIKRDMGGALSGVFNAWELRDDALDDGSGADNGTIVGDVIYTGGCEFTSRFTFGAGTALVADMANVAMNDKIGIGYLVQAA
jgi:hypothetical protein